MYIHIFFNFDLWNLYISLALWNWFTTISTPHQKKIPLSFSILIVLLNQNITFFRSQSSSSLSYQNGSYECPLACYKFQKSSTTQYKLKLFQHYWWDFFNNMIRIYVLYSEAWDEMMRNILRFLWKWTIQIEILYRMCKWIQGHCASTYQKVPVVRRLDFD